VSSKVRWSFPLYVLQYSSFRIMFRAFPMWSAEEGNGASRITTFPFVALSSGRIPIRSSRLDVLVFRFSNSCFCCSGERLFISFRFCWIFGMMFLISDFCSPSANSPESTAPWFAFPLYFVAFSRA